MAHNIWDNVPDADEVPKVLIDLNTIIDFKDFQYDQSYLDGERDILTPQLEALGYKHVQFLPGDGDCWGPLTRLCRAMTHDNQIMWFMYG